MFLLLKEFGVDEPNSFEIQIGTKSDLLKQYNQSIHHIGNGFYCLLSVRLFKIINPKFTLSNLTTFKTIGLEIQKCAYYPHISKFDFPINHINEFVKKGLYDKLNVNTETSIRLRKIIKYKNEHKNIPKHKQIQFDS